MRRLVPIALLPALCAPTAAAAPATRSPRPVVSSAGGDAAVEAQALDSGPLRLTTTRAVVRAFAG